MSDRNVAELSLDAIRAGSRGGHRGRRTRGAVRAARHLARRRRRDPATPSRIPRTFRISSCTALMRRERQTGRPRGRGGAASRASRSRAPGWGQDNPVYRQLFTSRFVPGATRRADPLVQRALQDARRRAEMAARIMEFRLHIDVIDLLPRVSVPTLVLHARDDEAVLAVAGALLATRIPGATFVELDSRNHILLETEPAWARFKEEVLAFTGQTASRRRRRRSSRSLSPREREILMRIAAGPHQHRDRPRALHQREDRPQSRHADLREARRAVARAGDRAREGSRAAANKGWYHLTLSCTLRARIRLAAVNSRPLIGERRAQPARDRRD